ncbi:Fe(2+) transport protein A [Abditibacteriota bacterium]|nr:Fe(2+) transport protein A [Abditibacteriota bacterium]
MTLAELSVGNRARILTLGGDEEAVERMMEMGLVEGTEFSLVRFAPLGDPLEIKTRGYHLTLRKAEAANIEVEKL